MVKAETWNLETGKVRKFNISKEDIGNALWKDTNESKEHSKKYREIAEIIIDLKRIQYDIKQVQSSNPILYQGINYRLSNMISKLIYEDKEIKEFIHQLLQEK